MPCHSSANQSFIPCHAFFNAFTASFARFSITIHSASINFEKPNQRFCNHSIKSPHSFLPVFVWVKKYVRATTTAVIAPIIKVTGAVKAAHKAPITGAAIPAIVMIADMPSTIIANIPSNGARAAIPAKASTIACNFLLSILDILSTRLSNHLIIALNGPSTDSISLFDNTSNESFKLLRAAPRLLLALSAAF